MQESRKGQWYQTVQPALFLLLLLVIVGALGWLVATVGAWASLQVALAIGLPVLLMVGCVQAGRAKLGWLVTVLTLALWALAAWGAWTLLR